MENNLVQQIKEFLKNVKFWYLLPKNISAHPNSIKLNMITSYYKIYS